MALKYLKVGPDGCILIDTVEKWLELFVSDRKEIDELFSKAEMIALTDDIQLAAKRLSKKLGVKMPKGCYTYKIGKPIR